MAKFLCEFIHRMSYKLYDIKALYYAKIVHCCGKELKLWGGGISFKNPHNIALGNHVSINDGVYINGLGGVFIGNNVALSAGCKIISTGLDPSTLKIEKVHINKPIRIGDNVQIGAGAIVLAGVEIGDNVIIGAGAIVTKSIESNSIAHGSPAAIRRKI